MNISNNSPKTQPKSRARKLLLGCIISIVIVICLIFTGFYLSFTIKNNAAPRLEYNTPTAIVTPKPTFSNPLVGRIAFSSPVDSTSDMILDYYSQVFVMDANGENVKQLTNDNNSSFEPDWSPDGRKIVYVTERQYRDYQIYVMNEDGTDITQLTDNELGGEHPDWSPDGLKIAFSALTKDEISVKAGHDIYIMNSDGSDVTRIDNPGNDKNPDWSPDGTRIVYQHDDGEIYVMTADGREHFNLTNTLNCWENFPTWSPDGTRIAFMGHGSDTQPNNIFIINSDGSNRINLTNNPSSAFYPLHPTWSPDGTKLIYISEGKINVIEVDGSASMLLIPSIDSNKFSYPDWSLP